ncbi:hypothetical protein B0H14DRAFT_3733860 [Mycena olivaceomarginata]|nr:hypothetical protein B0H14DRAFT_3733860 [Mycena olivaceomarginata]
MTRAVLAEDEDVYESALPRAHASPVHRTSRASGVQGQAYSGGQTSASSSTVDERVKGRCHRSGTIRAIRSSTLNDVANIDLELDELLHAPGGHYRISVASRTIPLQVRHGVDAQDLRSAAASASDPRQCWRAQDQDDTAADLGGWDIQGTMRSCARNVPLDLATSTGKVHLAWRGFFTAPNSDVGLRKDPHGLETEARRRCKRVRRWLQSGFEVAEAVGLLAERDAKGTWHRESLSRVMNDAYISSGGYHLQSGPHKEQAYMGAIWSARERPDVKEEEKNPTPR